MRAEAEKSLLLGVSAMVERGDPALTTEQPYFASGYVGPLMVGCALRTPPYGLALSRWDNEKAIDALVRDVAFAYPDLPGANGPEPTATAFAEKWTRHTGTTATLMQNQRIFELRSLTPPPNRPNGALRPAVDADVPLLVEWAVGFARDTKLPMHRSAPELVADRLRQQSLYVWDNGAPVSMAAWTGKTPTGVRINFVYTPGGHRGRGYASACVAALTAQLLKEGNTFCSLYTDASNPTSNSIYQKLGYRPICEVGMYGFGRPRA